MTLPQPPLSQPTAAAKAPPRRALHPLSRLLACAVLACVTPDLHAACIDDDKPDPALPAATVAGAAANPPRHEPRDPRRQLQTLVSDALQRSNGIGAARLLAEAAVQDVDEAKAAKLPQASAFASLNPNLVASGGRGGDSTGSQLQARAGVNLSQTLFDGGRADRLVDLIWTAGRRPAASGLTNMRAVVSARFSGFSSRSITSFVPSRPVKQSQFRGQLRSRGFSSPDRSPS